MKADYDRETAHPTANPRLLRKIKIGIAIMLVVFSYQIFVRSTEFWPLTRWAMYARAGGGIVERLGGYELHATDSVGRIHRLQVDDLGFLGRNILLDSFGARDMNTRHNYRELLIYRVQLALPDTEVIELEGWELVWEVDSVTFPPVDLNNPISQTSLGKFPVSFYIEPTSSPDSDLDLLFGDRLALLAFRVTGPNKVAQCEQLYVRTWWRTIAHPPDDYHITLVLADESGVGRAQSDSLLAYALTSSWQIGQDNLDRRFIEIPCDLPVGNYDLLVGLYPIDTVQNLQITYPDGSPYGQLGYLTTIEVEETGQ